MQSLKTAVDIMQNRPQPLVIFPEGDVYHTNDRVTPFRDGAAAMALMAARKAERPVVIIPVAIKRWYTQDPTPSMLKTIEELERRLFWRPRHNESMRARILHVADGLLTLKELEYFGNSTAGDPASRLRRLASSVLSRCEDRYSIRDRDAMIPERIKEVRRRIIQARQEHASHPGSSTDQSQSSVTPEQQRQWSADMDDMFFVTQLYSYPGDYMEQNPTWERQAETLDKLEEDALGATFPSVRGPRRVIVRFDEAYELPRGKDKKVSPAEVTDYIERRVQMMLDELNSSHG